MITSLLRQGDTHTLRWETPAVRNRKEADRSITVWNLLNESDGYAVKQKPPAAEEEELLPSGIIMSWNTTHTSLLLKNSAARRSHTKNIRNARRPAPHVTVTRQQQFSVIKQESLTLTDSRAKTSHRCFFTQQTVNTQQEHNKRERNTFI